MNLDTIEERFNAFLDTSWKLSDIAPFLFAYIKLLLLFKSQLSINELNIILERQKQLSGEKFNDEGFDNLRSVSRREMERNFKNNISMTKKAILNRLLFCIMLDSEESDFFYLTEPMYEFVRNMKISPSQLQEILELEFDGFKV